MERFRLKKLNVLKLTPEIIEQIFWFGELTCYWGQNYLLRNCLRAY